MASADKAKNKCKLTLRNRGFETSEKLKGIIVINACKFA